MVPESEPLIWNQCKPITTPLQTTFKTGPIVKSPLKKLSSASGCSKLWQRALSYGDNDDGDGVGHGDGDDDGEEGDSDSGDDDDNDHDHDDDDDDDDDDDACSLCCYCR